MAKIDAEAALEHRLVELPKKDRKALVQEFCQLYRSTPPKHLSIPNLRLAIAYRLQEQVYGGLSPATRKLLLSASPQPKALLSTGSVLIREWHGKTHVVTMKPEGIEYDGQRFRSLTEVTRRITGQKRSGPSFFGLKKAPQAKGRHAS